MSHCKQISIRNKNIIELNNYIIELNNYMVESNTTDFFEKYTFINKQLLKICLKPIL